MLNLMHTAHTQQIQLIVYPEIAFTTFFPRHLLSPSDLEPYFERDTNNDPTLAPNMKPVFDQARSYGMDVSVGYAECVENHDSVSTETAAPHVHYNTAVYYSARADRVVSKYRKVHLPGTVEPYERVDATNQLEKRYFRPGDLGFEAFRAPGLVEGVLEKRNVEEKKVNEGEMLGRGDPVFGMLICNDRRWPEAWRAYGLQGVELVLCGYNTTGWAPELVGTNPKIKTKEMAKEEALFHNKLSVQHGSYSNACWSVNVAKCGMEDHKYPLIGGSCIIDPDGQVVVEAQTEEDELIPYEIDLEYCRRGKGKVFAFERHRRIEHYGIISSQTGVVEPELL